MALLEPVENPLAPPSPSVLPHPTRQELVERYGEPDDLAAAGGVSNRGRAEFADDALRAFACSCGIYLADLRRDEQTYIAQLIGDLMHLVILNGGNPDQVVERGREHFIAEVGLGYDPENDEQLAESLREDLGNTAAGTGADVVTGGREIAAADVSEPAPRKPDDRPPNLYRKVK